MSSTAPALRHRDFLQADRDYEQAAEAANLLYVKDSDPGIHRIRKGSGFSYMFEDKPVHDKKAIERIRRLVIPPAWTRVWICPSPNGHIQATGLDLRQRKQYRYHELWNSLRNETKFHHLFEFGKQLPKLRERLELDLGEHKLNQAKVLATVISLMERTYIRIGSSTYEKTNGSYGLTTLKDHHVAVNGNKMLFTFKGKKGITHRIGLTNKKLARMVKQCRDIPGRELFQYYDENGERHSIDSGMVNQYIRDATGFDCTAKDFRTWAGSLHALQAFKSLGEAATVTENKKNILAALDEVSKKLGNTRTVCRKYYVHPALIDLYEQNNLARYLKDLDNIEEGETKTDYTAEEKVLMKILQQNI